MLSKIDDSIIRQNKAQIFCILKTISKMLKLEIKIGKSFIWEFKNFFETEKLRF